ncbi:MAG: putative Diaminopimelate decarboxylase [candidate division NC10 bacterium]|nr:putative Diaminopimelate decarboxylase [candidate division NC10 bacterium]
MMRDGHRLASSATRRLLSRNGPLRTEGGQLWIEGLPSRELVERLGTPILVYSSARLRDNIEQAIEATRACAFPIRIHYALKACYLVGVVGLVKEAGLNVEVMSEFEYLLARRIGFAPDQVIVNGPAKRPEFLERVVTDGVALMNVESLPEIAFLDALGQRLGKAIQVGFRINPLPSRHLRGPFAPPGSKFGFDVPTGEAAEAVVLDFGGGFGSRSIMEANGGPLRSFIAKMTEPLAGLSGDREIVMEPGRYLVNDAAVCLTTVLSCKRNGRRRWVLVDAGRNILPPRKNAEYAVIPCEVRPGRTLYHVGDFLCMPSEPIPLSFVSGPIELGDRLAVFNAGAYTFSMAQSFGEPIPNAILVEKAEWTWLYRKRSIEEQCRDLSGQT